MFSRISKQSPRRAMTLVEVVMAVGIIALLMLAIGSFVIYSGRSMASIFNYTDMGYGSRQALDVMTRDIRQSIRLKTYTTNQLVLVDFDGTDLSFEYTTNKTLVRTKGESQTTLLTGCDWIRFNLYMQNPVKGTYTLKFATNTADSKVIGVSWNCSRKVLGTINSEPMQEALIVVRKR